MLSSSQKKAFTIIELLVAVAILSVLASTAMITFSSYGIKARLAEGPIVAKSARDWQFSNFFANNDAGELNRCFEWIDHQPNPGDDTVNIYTKNTSGGWPHREILAGPTYFSVGTTPRNGSNFCHLYDKSDSSFNSGFCPSQANASTYGINAVTYLENGESKRGPGACFAFLMTTNNGVPVSSSMIFLETQLMYYSD